MTRGKSELSRYAHPVPLCASLSRYAHLTYLGRLVEELRYNSVSDYQTDPSTPAEWTHTTYDSLGRASVVDEYVGASTTPSRETTTTYDPITGQVQSIVSPEGTINYAYDPATGQHIRTWTANNDTVYVYDTQGRLAHVYTLMLNGLGYATFDHWDKLNHVPVFGSGTPLETTYSYDAVGNLSTDSQPDGYTATYAYDSLNRLTLETVTKGSTLVETFDYNQTLVAAGSKDPLLMLRTDGLRQGVVDTRYESDGTTVHSQTTTAWLYDALGRMTDETLTVNTSASDTPVPYHDHFIFDLANNRVEEDTTGGDTGTGAIIYVYNSDDQLLHETRTGTDAYQIDYGHYSGAFIKGYDANGSRTEENRTGFEAESDSYTWDLRGRMTSAKVNGVTTSYAYDSGGVRVSETSGTDTTTYLNDPNNPTGYTKAVEENSTVTGLRSYVLGLKVEGQRDAAHGTVLMITDGHGSTRELVDLSTGSIVQHYDYDAYGIVLGVTGLHATYWTDWLFAGDGLYDPASGWTYNLARWRDGFLFPSMDSFSGDPNSPASLHKYLYANADPLNGWDPTGYADFTIAGELGVTGLQLGLLGLGLVAFGASLQLAHHTAAAASATSAVINDIEDWINSGASALEAEGSKLLGRAADVAKAIDAAIQEAYDAGRATLSALRKLKIFPIVESAGPAIYAFDVGALARQPAWYVLNYNGLTPSGVLRTAANRAYVFSFYGKVPAPSGKQLDEFPFASTLQGGRGVFGSALGTYVPADQNSFQGTLLYLFYNYELKWGTGPFLVVPIAV